MSEAAKNLEDEGKFKILAKCSPGAVDLSKKNGEQAAFADFCSPYAWAGTVWH